VEGGVYARIVTLCRLVPSISPHPAGHAGSVWDLPWVMWVGFAQFVDEYVREAKRDV
jgi:hypothetical protein